MKKNLDGEGVYKKNRNDYCTSASNQNNQTERMTVSLVSFLSSDILQTLLTN